MAVELPAPVREAMGELVRDLARCRADVRWVEEENFHLTLKFLGETPQPRLAAAAASLAEAGAGVSGFRLRAEGLRVFPDLRRARVLWVGVADDSGRLSPLVQRLEAAFARRGFAPERRPFRPHLTIGRVKRPTAALDRLASLLDTHADFDAGQTRVDEVVVFASQLRPSGPVYQPLARARLNGL